MASKNITITEEAYDRLAEAKREDESFTDVIVRLTRADRDVWAGFGAWNGTGLRDVTEANRERFERDAEDRRALSRQ